MVDDKKLIKKNARDWQKTKTPTEIRVQKPCDTDQIKLYHEMTDNQTERELDKTKKYKFYCTTPN